MIREKGLLFLKFFDCQTRTGFRKQDQGEIPKFVICFMVKDDVLVPYYKIEGESETWIELPHNNGTYYDPVEDYDEYQRNIEFIDRGVKEELGEFYGGFGSCHLAWKIKKTINGVLWNRMAFSIGVKSADRF